MFLYRVAFEYRLMREIIPKPPSPATHQFHQSRHYQDNFSWPVKLKLLGKA